MILYRAIPMKAENRQNAPAAHGTASPLFLSETRAGWRRGFFVLPAPSEDYGFGCNWLHILTNIVAAGVTSVGPERRQ